MKIKVTEITINIDEKGQLTINQLWNPNAINYEQRTKILRKLNEIASHLHDDEFWHLGKYQKTIYNQGK